MIGAAGVTAADCEERAPLPRALKATTVHVYVLPFVRWLTTIGDLDRCTVPIAPPFDDRHVEPKLVIGLPPLLGARKLNVDLRVTGTSPRAVPGGGARCSA